MTIRQGSTRERAAQGESGCEAPRRLPRSYTNDTVLHGSRVVKSYTGPDAAGRRRREVAALRALYGRVPVPRLLGHEHRSTSWEFVEGAHGQDLIEAGLAVRVLAACGATLRTVHDVVSVDVPAVAGTTPNARRTLVHGDYGPNNVLLDPTGARVIAVLDWEWAHLGDPIEDLAWCEWIVRTHHAEQVDALDAFFDAYGQRPAWRERQRRMLERCEAMIEFCHAWQPDGVGVRQWRRRVDVTASWRE